MTIQLLQTDEELTRCVDVMRELRPKYTGAEQMLPAMRSMLAEGALFAALQHEGEIATVAGFRVQQMLVSGKTLYVDDLVTAERLRSRGFGKAMLEWLMGYAKEQGCETFSLDSGTFRQSAHAFYFREGLRISSFHFQRTL